MAEQLPSVPEETTSSFTAPSPPPHSYRESIRSVDGPEWRIRSTLFPQSGQSGSDYSSSYSGTSSSYLSNISGSSSGLVAADISDFGAGELTKIAHKMVSDGYIQQLVQTFGGQPDSALQTWFSELDIALVLQSRESHDSHLQPQPQELVERWIRSLTLIVVSIKEMVAAGHVTPAVTQFGKGCISAMLDFVHIFNISMAEKLHAMLHMYICVSAASNYMYLCMVPVISSEAQHILNEIGGLLEREENKLMQAISGMIMEAETKTFINDDDSWAIEILQGGGEVHRNVRLLVGCIILMRKSQSLSQNSAQSHNIGKLRDLIDCTVSFLKNLLLKKSALCSDPSLKYMFLLNNFYFIASELFTSLHERVLYLSLEGLELTPECEKHMDSYLEVSWGYVLSCIPKSNSHGPIRRWINTSTLARFQSAFHKTYNAQKFWKVPDPWLRSLLRKTITKRVISGYQDYLKEHPELEKQVMGGSNSPEVLEEMLAGLFEG